MDRIEKLLRRIPKKDRLKIEEDLQHLFHRDFHTLDRDKLKGHKHTYRIRTGNYRIIYDDDGKTIILKAIKRRNEGTYKGKFYST
jgi:mRNA-degrading endonuclease RelE of RelBE toxin-antitoxin system